MTNSIHHPLFACLAACFMWAFLALTPSAQAQGLVRDAEIENLLRDMTDPVLEVAGLRPEDVRILLINDPSMNAFVANGQRIHFHTGIIVEADTPNELLGVIAHETGHIAGGHLARMSEGYQAAMGPTIVALGLGVLAIAAGAPDAGAALLAGSQQFGMMEFLGYRRNQESAADQASARYLNELNEPIDGIVAFFRRFQYQEALSQARRFPYFRTHPLASERVSALVSKADEQRARWASEGYVWEEDPKMIERYELARAKIIGFLYAASRVWARYPETDTSAPARYARAISAFQAADIVTSQRIVETLIEDDPLNPYYHELLGQALFETGNVEASVDHHRSALELAPEEPLLMINLARSLLAVGGEEKIYEAEDLLGSAITREPDNAFAWAQRAIAYEQMDRRGDALVATAEQAYALGNRQRAFQFARRAQAELEVGTPSWQRAVDIISATDPRIRAGRRGGFAPGQAMPGAQQNFYYGSVQATRSFN